MAAIVTTFFRALLRAVFQPTSPGAGSVTYDISVDQHLGNGTGAYQADKVYRATLSVGTSGTEVDLQTATDVYNVALGADEVVALAWKASVDNTAAVNVSGGASNPWEAWLLATGDGVKLPPGAVLSLAAFPDGALPVSSAAKTVKFAAASGTQTVDVMFVCRSQ